MAGDEGQPLTHDRDLTQLLRLYGVREADLRVGLRPVAQPTIVIDDSPTVAERLAVPEQWHSVFIPGVPTLFGAVAIIAVSECRIFWTRPTANCRVGRSAVAVSPGLLTPILPFYSRSSPVAIVEAGAIAPVPAGGIGMLLDTGILRYWEPSLTVPRGETFYFVNPTAGQAFNIDFAFTEVPGG